MTISPDGIAAAANWEHTLHPKRPDGKDITAWARRGVTLEATIAEVNRLTTQSATELALLRDIDAKLDQLLARPF